VEVVVGGIAAVLVLDLPMSVSAYMSQIDNPFPSAFQAPTI